ncbi:MAG: glucose-6-phosphate dehydrogenase, partial [Solirubrobacterales bacterium]|nr:glucose-6-phosphate dehydrogenase [Solirubrobacterales bacterium]
MSVVDQEEQDTEADENPLVEGLERLPVHPTALVIFGATGDLAHRKLLPALYNLAHEGALPERFELVGIARSDQGHDDYRDTVRESVERFSRRQPDPDVLEGLIGEVRYIPGSFDDPDVYAKLGRTLDELDSQAGHPLDRVFYLSTAPQFFPVIAQALGDAGLNRAKDSEVRIVIEKPFGYDLASARALNERVLGVFDESQVFRLDHYLGKETVQNLMALRFANALFEPVWNRNFIDNVQLTAAEDIGIEGRAGYYEGAGALRDLVQNHMLQLLALLTMEPPASFEANRLRDEKLKVLEAIVPPTTGQVAEMAVRAQYGPGVSAGTPVPGYLEEEGVNPNSRTETYAALRLHISNWRWAGVPFYLRTGKRLARKVTDIAVTLKPVPHLAFQTSGSVGVQPNQIILTVQP